MYHIHLSETISTMQDVRDALLRGLTDDVVVVSADYQKSGRGQRGNSWESERGRNLLFSMAFCPVGVRPAEQFVISEALSISIVETLREISASLQVCVKWPNDIYIGDRKLAGILIEHDLQGNAILRTVAGVGLNVNQMVFQSDAPNPVSLKQVLGKELDCQVLLESIISKFCRLMGLDGNAAIATSEQIHRNYMNMLYRRTGLFPYRAGNKTFMAEIADVSLSGILSLRHSNGELLHFGFKEVEFVINPPYDQ